jgi:hypothetical protein
MLVLLSSPQATQEPQHGTYRSPSRYHRMHLHSVVEATRELPEVVLGRVVYPYRGVQLVPVDLGARLVVHLGAEGRS